ncbi:adenylyltransferase/cytidyltransferase family protein [bacterium]|jgi:cytidyltransferase-like protein|nr:adenylyltransferase/cytidyltransferase family protein [bacterium]MDC1007076.1 adenylyltransferase/cytidyltransferase family protein [bacterium]
MNVVLVTGGFDPLHKGHIEYFKEAKKLGDKLIVGVNSDEWLTRKKGRPFMPFEDRCAIIKELSIVDKVIGFDDSDDSACQAIFHTLSTHGNIKVIFANGGDRTNTTTPEYATYGDMPNVEFAFGVGGTNKMNSSSWILDEWKTQKTERQWGYWRVLDHKPEQGYKVKELVIYPGKALSDQKHFKRAEQWIVLEGVVDMQTEWNGNISSLQLTPHRLPYEIGKEVWHLASNTGTENAHILEIQWGSECIEEDIERRN